MCDLEYNFKAMSKKDMVKRLEELVTENNTLKAKFDYFNDKVDVITEDRNRCERELEILEVKLDLETRYKVLYKIERDKAKLENMRLNVENKELEEKNEVLNAAMNVVFNNFSLVESKMCNGESIGSLQGRNFCSYLGLHDDELIKLKNAWEVMRCEK